jgi:transcriptional regulator of acetoin/glycerol metabolism
MTRKKRGLGLFFRVVDCFKRDLILMNLRETNWNITHAARDMGMRKGTLHKLINELDLRAAVDAGQQRMAEFMDYEAE